VSGERTFKATAHRRQEARKKGQVLKSSELSMGIVFMGMFLLLKWWLPSMMNEVTKFMQLVYRRGPIEYTIPSAQLIINEAGLVVVKAVWPIMLGALLMGILVNFLQVGSLFTLKPLSPDFERINPVAGFKRLFSIRTLVELVKSLLKLSLLSYLVYSTLVNDVRSHLFEIHNTTLTRGISLIGSSLAGLTWKVALVFLVLGVADYLYQWWEYERSLMMSHQEMKEEMRNMEGDPQQKGELKRKQKAISMRRMMQEVPKADVIITNPTHFAVAILYSSATMDAPQVVAKGQDEVALRIREVAQEHRVPLVENPPLARSLYRSVEVGQPVPAELFKAVAEVLAFVYRLNRRHIS